MKRTASVRAYPPGSLKKRLWKQRWLFVMLIPGIIWFLVFKYATYAGLALSFTNYGFRKTVSFVGLRNFQRLFKSMSFWNAFRNTLLISLYNIVFYFPSMNCAPYTPSAWCSS